MAVPIAIRDSLESIVEIYFSPVRGRERAAFILCDNLVEMACKTCAKEHNHRFDTSCNFHNAVNAPGVILAGALKQRVKDSREVRNNMQHASAAATVDGFYCATAILDAVEVIDSLWPVSAPDSNFAPRVACALRILRLHTSDGDPIHRDEFEDKMRAFGWRSTDSETVRINSVQVEPGKRDYWWWTLRHRLPNVEDVLNEIGAP